VQEQTGERKKVVEMVQNDPAHDLEIQSLIVVCCSHTLAADSG
jgi:hypothetical protein